MTYNAVASVTGAAASPQGTGPDMPRRDPERMRVYRRLC
jgi:hypothetical protein